MKFKALATLHITLPSHPSWAPVRQDRPKRRSKYRINQQANQGSQRRNIKLRHYTGFEYEWGYRPCIRGLSQTEPELLRHGESCRIPEPTYGDTLSCSLVWVLTIGRHGRNSQAQYPSLSGGVLAKTTKNSTKTEMYKAKEKTDWKTGGC